jgi:hypothetical protein
VHRERLKAEIDIPTLQAANNVSTVSASAASLVLVNETPPVADGIPRLNDRTTSCKFECGPEEIVPL